VKKLDQMVDLGEGFQPDLVRSGQNYSRKIDAQDSRRVRAWRSSAHKVRQRCGSSRISGRSRSPFDEHQVGSRAMSTSVIPMKSERMTSLARLSFAADERLVHAAFSVVRDGRWTITIRRGSGSGSRCRRLHGG